MKFRSQTHWVFKQHIKTCGREGGRQSLDCFNTHYEDLVAHVIKVEG